MAKPVLRPKPISPIVPIALKLKELGYRPLPLRSGKSTPNKGWKLEPDTVEEIGRWNGRTVAVWMQASDDLFAIDLDVQIQEVLDRILARYQARWPEFFAGCLIRHSDAVKVMLIGRLTTDRKHVYTARYGADVVAGGNRVELFTSNDPGYVAVWGEHSKGRMYGYDGPDILERRLADLPEFLDGDLNELLTIATEEMEAAGLTKTDTASSGNADIAYDLEPSQVALLTDGREMTLEELESEASGQFVYLHGRLFDPGTDTANRCKAKVTSRGLTIWDWGTSTVHYWKHLGPQPEVLAPLLRTLADADVGGAAIFRSAIGPQAARRTASDEPPEYPPDGAGFNVRLLWLLRSYGYCALNDSVVELFEAGSDCEIKPGAFERRFAGWYREEVVGRGAVRMIPATDDWARTEHRVHVAGARMHPGQDFPLYREAGKLWKNIYQRPVHVGTGDLGPFWRFFNNFIPDKVEREWLLDWMAHKQMRPDIPGSAIILVADNDEEEDERAGKYGTGRGSMFKILHRLYGPSYARGQSFSVLDGSSSQSAYTAWIHGNILVTVDETRTSATAHRRGEKKSVYEVLKDVVDPAPKGMTFQVKYGRSFWGYSYCSFWLATNHADALSIPKNDRRFTVLQNGAVLTPEQGRELAEWMEVPGNIAELSRFLAARELGAFNMFQHLETRGRDTMIEMSRSTVEEHLIELRDDDTRGLVFTRQQLEHAIEDIVQPWEHRRGIERRRGGGQWRGEFAAAWSEYCVGLKTEDGIKFRIRVEGRQVKLYCFRKRRKEAMKLPPAARQAQAAKWGGLRPLNEGFRGLTGGKGSQKEDE